MPDRELDVTELMAGGWSGLLKQDEQNIDLVCAVELASAQDVTTWLTANGKRIAKIAPADPVPDDDFVLTVPPGFLQLPESERKAAIRDRFYRNLRGPA